MRKKTKKKNKGFKKAIKSQGLLEVIICLGLLFVFVAGAASCVNLYLSSFNKARELNQIKTLAEQSFEALESIAYNNWEDLANGDFDLTSSKGSWDLTAYADEYGCLCKCKKGQGQGYAWGHCKCKSQGKGKGRDSQCVEVFKYKRKANINPAYRDESCNLVESGGTEDPDTKQISITIDWDTDSELSPKTFSKYFTNWQAPSTCLSEPDGGGGEAGPFTVDISKAKRSVYSSWFYPLKTFDKIQITNNGPEAVTIDKMQIFMDDQAVRLYDLYVDNHQKWYWWFYDPQGFQPSGATLDTDNFTIQPGQEIKVKLRVLHFPDTDITFSINFITDEEAEGQTDDFTL